METTQTKIRETSQFQLPVTNKPSVSGYDIYPVFSIPDGTITIGYDTLAKELAQYKCVKIDGYVGIRFDDVKQQLNDAFLAMGQEPTWINIESALKPKHEIDEMIAPFLGGDDPVFGKITTLELSDFYNASALNELCSPQHEGGMVIYYGIGAHMLPVEAKMVYFDISKNEIQFRSRAGSVTNLGAGDAFDPKKMYKRFYFIDWLVLNKHKNNIKTAIDYLVDGQRTDEITWTTGNTWRDSIAKLSKSPIRVRPWFEPGVWGGSWIKDKIEGLEKDVPNYAWSFELIVPENGIIIESAGILLEYSFDFLMYNAGKNVLGTDFDTYKYEFPIRFDFLDTFDGGNLSIQCHPQMEYMKQHFGESITQEETYYILDKKDDALVYLGFQENINPDAFKQALEHSADNAVALNINDYVQAFKANKHDLYLIPPGTIHGSGENNLVLEISATPYIYTFKMYDWVRLDMDGKPRPINIDRGMENLDFERKGDRVSAELISSPEVIETGDDWTLEHLPTHANHLYDVHRYSIGTEVRVATNQKAHVLSLVEGEHIEIIVNGESAVFAYAETFIIPAACNHYIIKNKSDKPALVVKSFIK
ncbi:class I mannose-6-phosphate isomerase [Flavobacterium rhizosphaerae]|uniref:Class I mannose-6-phosphate isomerase n=1 Tax=Flavobacterium rhizosphaerae TaxID=3163298 RepID=A0ABW8YW34_9FLAO